MSESPVPKRTGAPTVVVSDRQRIPVDGSALAALAEETLAGEGVGEGELSLSFVSGEEMADLHQRFMHEPGPTDVLSFPLHEEGLLGDVVVCPEYAAGNAEDLDTELRLLVVHGVLHVLGHDHQEDAGRAEMWARQERYSGVRAP
ncbi:MAG: rRNA maturation RNase YbeY [Actinomycetota bacterium]